MAERTAAESASSSSGGRSTPGTPGAGAMRPSTRGSLDIKQFSKLRGHLRSAQSKARSKRASEKSAQQALENAKVAEEERTKEEQDNDKKGGTTKNKKKKTKSTDAVSPNRPTTAAGAMTTIM